jgi:Fic family protein
VDEYEFRPACFTPSPFRGGFTRPGNSQINNEEAVSCWDCFAPLPRMFQNLIFELPYCRIQHLTERGIAGRQTASVYLKELVKIGALEEKSVGR